MSSPLERVGRKARPEVMSENVPTVGKHATLTEIRQLFDSDEDVLDMEGDQVATVAWFRRTRQIVNILCGRK